MRVTFGRLITSTPGPHASPEPMYRDRLDDQRRAFYRRQLRVDFLEHKGPAFQDWFCRLAEFALRTDFQRIRSDGRHGVYKTDGRSLSDRTIYRCYAPHAMSQARLRGRIERDFRGAFQSWDDWMKRWVFVHNGSRNLSPEVVEDLDSLRERHPQIEIIVWSEPEIVAQLFSRLDSLGLEMLFGPVP